MHDLIQIIEILSSEEVKKLNEYIDTLTFQPNTVFGEGEKATARTEVRSSTGCILSEDETFTKNLPSNWALSFTSFVLASIDIPLSKIELDGWLK